MLVASWRVTGSWAVASLGVRLGKSVLSHGRLCLLLIPAPSMLVWAHDREAKAVGGYVPVRSAESSWLGWVCGGTSPVRILWQPSEERYAGGECSKVVMWQGLDIVV